MKKHPGFFPRKDADKAIWYSIFRKNISIVGPSLNFSQEKIEKLEQICSNVINSIDEVHKTKTDAAAAVSHKNRMVEEGERIIGSIAAFIKNLEGDHSGAQVQLGILGSAQEIDKENLKPVIKVAGEMNKVRIDFVKKYTQAIAIYSKPEGQMDWTFVDYAIESPYYDTRPVAEMYVPEVREYRAVCIHNTKPIGQFSDICVVVVR